MKKYLSTLMLMVIITITATAQKVGEQMYIYSNGQPFGGFLPAEIDSITYSCYDEDGIRYDDAVVQVIHTPDSIYRIPINDVDSVSFVRPSTIYKSGVIVLEGEIRQYILNSDGFNLTLSANTPSRLVPKVGDRLATMEPDDQFPHFFAGEVKSVTTANGGIEVTCETLEFEDVVEQYANVVYAASEGDGGEQSPSRAPTSNKAAIPWTTIQLPSYRSSTELANISISPIPDIRNIEPSINFGAGFTYSIVPEARARITWFIRGGLYINAMMILDNTFSWSHHFNGNITANRHQSFLPNNVEVKIGPTPFNLYFDCGWFASVSGDLVWENSIQRKTRTTLTFVYDRNHPENNTASRFTKDMSSSDDIEGKLYGDISAEGGIYAEAGIDLIRRQVVKVGARAEIGIKGSASNLRLWDGIENAHESTEFYDNIKDGEISLTPFLRMGGVWGVAENLPIGASGSFLKNEISFLPGFMYKAVPSFYDLKAERPDRKSTTVMVSASVGEHVLFPSGVGFTAVNKDKERVSTEWLPRTYGPFNMFPNASLDLKNVPLSGKYHVNPMVRLFGHEVMASPEVEVPTEIPVKITEFKQTDSHYQKDGYSHDGRTYDYKYDVAVTVELTDDEGVADWGYVYRDPYGNIAHISLKNYGSPYTDTRYVYYRDESKSTVTLYEYVKYEGEDDYVYGEPKDYDVSHSLTYCPDGNHPHMIDLGLPSGTKWACCNVGATTPEGYGGYYAWGETEEKNYYSCDTYQYWTDSDGNGYWDSNEFTNLGSDIAGTGYDVAHVKWGGSWVMPSLDQILELLNKCTYTWTSKNGVKGGQFTGPSGGTIFLPAAGYRWYGNLDGAGSYGYYWSSAQSPSRSYRAYDLDFSSGRADCNDYYGDRYYGHTVRPVSR